MRSLNSYISELKARAAEHGTDRAHFEDDMVEAEHNAAYYESEIARLKAGLGGAGGRPPSKGVIGGALPQTVNQGVGTLLISGLCFAAGVLVGSRLWSGRDVD